VTVLVCIKNGKTRAVEELYKRRIRPDETVSDDLPELGLRIQVWHA
jgi:hypothetical protein